MLERALVAFAVGAGVWEAPRGMARPRALEPSPLALVGGVLAVISSFLAWDDMAQVAYDDSFKVPLQFLWDEGASEGFKLGLPLVIVASVVALLSLSSIAPAVFLRRLGGVLLLA